MFRLEIVHGGGETTTEEEKSRFEPRYGGLVSPDFCAGRNLLARDVFWLYGACGYGEVEDEVWENMVMKRALWWNCSGSSAAEVMCSGRVALLQVD